MSAEVTVEDRVNPAVLEITNKRRRSYKMRRCYSMKISINQCLNAHWPNINSGEYRRSTGSECSRRRVQWMGQAKCNLHNTDVSAKATRLSLTPLLIIRWQVTTICLNNSNMGHSSVPWERAHDSTYTSKNALANIDDGRNSKQGR